MVVRSRLEGLDELLPNLRGLSARHAERARVVMLATGAKILRRAQQYVPVEYGVLRASGYVRASVDDKSRTLNFMQVGSTSLDVSIEIGFSAEYAIFVHENMQQKLKGKPRPSGKGVYWGPQGRPKFLETAVRELQGEIVSDIVRYNHRFNDRYTTRAGGS